MEGKEQVKESLVQIVCQVTKNAHWTQCKQSVWWIISTLTCVLYSIYILIRIRISFVDPTRDIVQIRLPVVDFRLRMSWTYNCEPTRLPSAPLAFPCSFFSPLAFFKLALPGTGIDIVSSIQCCAVRPTPGIWWHWLLTSYPIAVVLQSEAG